MCAEVRCMENLCETKKTLKAFKAYTNIFLKICFINTKIYLTKYQLNRDYFLVIDY